MNGRTMTGRLIVLAVLLSVVSAACSGGGDDAGEGVASLSGAADDEVVAVPQPEDEIEEPSAEDALFEFTACMRENGLEIEDPTVDAEGNLEFRFRGGAGPQDATFDREAAQAARSACSGLLEGVALGFGRGDLTELQDNLFDFAACMRDNGYDMPDPDFSNFGGGGGGGSGEPGALVGPFGDIDQSDPDFEAAAEACSEILAGFGRVGGPGRGASPGGGGGGGGGGRGNG